jgi:xylose isomerase
MRVPTATYAARLNSFKVGHETYWAGKNGKITALDLVARAATVPGLGAVDLNYPDHLEGIKPAEMSAHLRDSGLVLNGFAMRYYTDPGFRLGAFTHPDVAVRRAAIDLTKRGIDALAECGGDLMTLWLGQDGFDYSFQADYARVWDLEVAGIAEVAAHNPTVDISLEYKPNEPRSFALLPDIGTTLLALAAVARPNLGVTLDFAHVLYADEMPAYAAALAIKHSRLLGVHLNDGYAKRDDGLMAGSVHLVQTLELLVALGDAGYDRAIYFDTFPEIAGLDPVAECAANIDTVEALLGVVARLRADTAAGQQLRAAIARQDCVASQRIVQAALFNRISVQP